MGRLTVLFRDLSRNTHSSGATLRLAGILANHLQGTDPDFKLGAIEYALWPHHFIALGPKSPNSVGDVLLLSFWSYGDTNAEAFLNLDRTLRNLKMALRRTAADFTEKRPRRP